MLINILQYKTNKLILSIMTNNQGKYFHFFEENSYSLCRIIPI